MLEVSRNPALIIETDQRAEQQDNEEIKENQVLE